MQEITFFWAPSEIKETEFRSALEIADSVVFMGYSRRSKDGSDCLFHISLKDGMGVEDLDRLSSKYKVKNVLSDTTEKNGRTFVVEMESTHPMSLLTSKLMAVSVQPGSKLDRNGMLMHVVGPNPSLKILYAAAKKWKNISRVSSKNLSIDELGPNEILNPHQFEVLQFAFNNGYYDSPKGCTIQDMANELNLSTTTVKDHLRKAEHQAIGQYFDSMNPNS